MKNHINQKYLVHRKFFQISHLNLVLYLETLKNSLSPLKVTELKPKKRQVEFIRNQKRDEAVGKYEILLERCVKMSYFQKRGKPQTDSFSSDVWKLNTFSHSTCRNDFLVKMKSTVKALKFEGEKERLLWLVEMIN